MKSGSVRSSLQAHFLLILASILLLAHTSQACRFNVRDVGFVDLGSQPYKLYCYVDDAVPNELATQVADISLAALLESNIEPEVVNLDTAKGHPGLQHATQEKNPGKPFAALVSPEGQSIILPLIELGKTPAESLWAAFESLYESPWRDKLMESVLKTYGAVIILEGNDPAENVRARTAVEKSIATIAQLIRDKKLEKDIAAPPVLHTLSRDKAASERITLWSLGLDLDDPGAQIAMLYGRGRQIGRALKGPQLNDRTIHAVLNTIGLSCECGLDRSWMQGAMLPMKWDEDVQQQVAQHLGFDPENPAIKMEMSQILSKGGSGQGAKTKVAQADIDTLLAGYSESAATPTGPDVDAPKATADNIDEAAPVTSDNNAQAEVMATDQTLPKAVGELPTAAPAANRSDRLRPMLLLFAGAAALVVGAGIVILLRGRGGG